MAPPHRRWWAALALQGRHVSVRMKYTDRDSMTLEEIARRATATSRALNNGRVTRARVLEVMQALKYSPNLPHRT